MALILGHERLKTLRKRRQVIANIDSERFDPESMLDIDLSFGLVKCINEQA